MMQLYVRTGCPFCLKVKAFVDERGILIEEKNIELEDNLEELLTLGGKRQVPFLVDGETKMYESDDIIAYLGNKDA
jgi:glutaredoxin 3